MATDKQDIIQEAIQLERDGRQFYLDAAGKASSDLARQMFESLADDEVIHIEWINKLSVEEGTAKNVKRKTYERLRGIFTVTVTVGSSSPPSVGRPEPGRAPPQVSGFQSGFHPTWI